MLIFMFELFIEISSPIVVIRCLTAPRLSIMTFSKKTLSIMTIA
jgi:hypothetical protein